MIDPEQLAAIATLWKRTGRTLTTRFTGMSMRPAIDDGAEVTLLCVDDVKVGDVVAYVYGDRVIVHRLVAQWGDRFVARGDANFLPDAMLLERGDIIGKIATPPPARPSRAASAFLAAIGVLGARMAMRIIGVLRVVGRGLRGGELRRFRANRLKSRRYGSIDVVFRPRLDGLGSVLARPFVDAVKLHVGKKVGRAFEWCAGPGFIGFALLAEGLCETLCLADINPDAIECVAETIRRNKLEDRVTFYTSDNFDSIPRSEKFDLVVSNPPNYFALNPAHRLYGRLKNDLRPNDRGWKIHEAFYRDVANYLNPGAILLIMEIETMNREVWLPGDKVPYDIRPRPPIEDFKRMITAGGLTYVETAPLITSFGFRGALVISTKL